MPSWASAVKGCGNYRCIRLRSAGITRFYLDHLAEGDPTPDTEDAVQWMDGFDGSISVYITPLWETICRNHLIVISHPKDLRETHSIGRQTREWIVTPSLSPTMSSHGMFLCGWSEARPGFTFIRPHFPMCHILVCVSGVGEVWVGGEWKECRPGWAYLTPAHVFHAYRAPQYQSSASRPWNVLWVTYYPPVVGGHRPRLVRADPEPLAVALRHLYAEVHGVAEPAMLALWTNLVHACAERIARPSMGNPRLRRLWNTVMDSPEQAWTVALLAAQVGVSDEQLRRLCQKEVGCSPMEHVTHLRMQHALSLLITGRYSVTFAAERVGYSNPFTFSTAFKRVVGVPPSRYSSVMREVLKKLTDGLRGPCEE